jgi:hypothetical protein
MTDITPSPKIEITPSPQETKNNWDKLISILDVFMTIKSISIAYKNNETDKWESYKLDAKAANIVLQVNLYNSKNFSIDESQFDLPKPRRRGLYDDSNRTYRQYYQEIMKNSKSELQFVKFSLLVWADGNDGKNRYMGKKTSGWDRLWQSGSHYADLTKEKVSEQGGFKLFFEPRDVGNKLGFSFNYVGMSDAWYKLSGNYFVFEFSSPFKTL